MFRENLLITCEHASPRVPASYQSVFTSAEARAAQKSHRGYDIGARALARTLSKRANLGLVEGEMTRLLIDLNRTRKHPALLSSFSKLLPSDARQKLIAVHEHHTELVEKRLRSCPLRKRAYHLGVHSFTPVLNDKVRATDIGLLYDPKRPGEVNWVRGFARELRAHSDLRIHLNRPYRGTSDGLTTYLRKKFNDRRYAGVELEINQGLLGTASGKRAMKKLLVLALAASLGS